MADVDMGQHSMVEVDDDHKAYDEVVVVAHVSACEVAVGPADNMMDHQVEDMDNWVMEMAFDHPVHSHPLDQDNNVASVEQHHGTMVRLDIGGHRHSMLWWSSLVYPNQDSKFEVVNC